MPRRTIIILVVLAVITLGLILLAVTNSEIKNSTKTIRPGKQITKDMIPSAKKTAVLSFDPAKLTVNSVSSASGYADITITTQNQKISGVQLELSFDPTVVSKMTFDPSINNIFEKGNFFTPTPSINYQAGMATYIIGIGPTATPIATQGKVVRVYFTARKPQNQNSSVITILNKSIVTQENVPDSILLKTNSLTLQF